AGVERVKYNVNNRDQVTAVMSGGPLHVSGQLDRPGMVDSVDGPVPTALDGTFSAWIDAIGGGSVTLNAQDYSGGNASTVASPSIIPGSDNYFIHDANGNLISAGAWEYRWDALDRLVAVER